VRLWLDTEFNGFGGPLISLALCADDGREFYQVVRCERPVPWVAENVIPVLRKSSLPGGELELAEKLREFLNQFDECRIVADWPDDVALFCRALIVGPGQRIQSPPLFFELAYDLPSTADISKVPHNALEDARALRKFGKDRP